MASRARDFRYNPRHLLARAPEHAGWRYTRTGIHIAVAGCSTVAVYGPGTHPGPALSFCVLPAKCHFPEVEPRGFEPLTSAVQRGTILFRSFLELAKPLHNRIFPS